MRGFHMAGLAAFASLGLAGAMQPPASSLTFSSGPALRVELAPEAAPARRRAKRGLVANTSRRFRARGAQAHPRRKPNRLHISRRVKRRHRKQRKAA